jgi:hypothetical protein
MDGGVTRWSVCLAVRCSLEDETEGKTDAGGHWPAHTPTSGKKTAPGMTGGICTSAAGDHTMRWQPGRLPVTHHAAGGICATRTLPISLSSTLTTAISFPLHQVGSFPPAPRKRGKRNSGER